MLWDTLFKRNPITRMNIFWGLNIESMNLFEIKYIFQNMMKTSIYYKIHSLTERGG